MHTIAEKGRIAVAWLRSFRRDAWEFTDYPVRVYARPNEDAAESWVAEFLNWVGPHGLGPSPEAAREALRAWFEETKPLRLAVGQRPPRPGTFVPMKVSLAPSDRVYADAELLDEFCQRILGREVFFVSDDSSLFHFAEDDDEVDHFRALIRGRYGVETDDLTGALLADILERIRAARDD